LSYSAAAPGLDLLHRGETLEFGRPDIERLVAGGAGMSLAEGLGPRPGKEVLLRAPNGVRGIEHMILALWAFEQMEGNEARHLVEMRFTRHPHLLEIVLGSLPHLESIHGNEHHHPH